MGAPAKAGPAASPPIPDVRSRYRGTAARDYLAHRQGSRKWALESATLDELLGGLPGRATILDAPVGTGRFLPAYARHGHRCVGIDVSPEMLAQARAGRRPPGAEGGQLVRGDVCALPLRDRAVDHAVSVRLLNWLDSGQLEQALAELRRVARGRLIVEVRLARPLGWRLLPGLLGELLRHPLASPRRLARSLLPVAGRAVLHLHAEAGFHQLLERLDLGIERRVEIPDGTAFSRRLLWHTPLRFYVLSRGVAGG